MKLRILTTLIVLLGFSPAKAGLYSCADGNSRPVEIKTGRTELLFLKTPPIFPPVAQDSNKKLENKTPFLVYYAVDSTEAFMQYSIRFEVASLIENCRKSSNVNFVGLVNSLYTEKNQIIVCKDRTLTNINLSQFSELDKKLKLKRNHILTADDDSDDMGPMEYRSAHLDESNKAFWKYPLAHPDFLYELINLVMTNENIFPTDIYAPFLNLKSHGSQFNVLAGMHKCQEKAKELSANKAINQTLSKEEIKFLNKQDTFEKVALNLIQYENIIGKIGLGNLRNNPDSSNNQLGEFNMGEFNMGEFNMGDAIAGLSVDHGLGGELAFGTGQPQLNWVLADLFGSMADDTPSDKALGFLMLESCDTKRDSELFHSYLNNVYGYYSAQHSLWYRNLNWWELLEMAEGSSLKLAEILKEKTAQIPNIELVKSK